MIFEFAKPDEKNAMAFMHWVRTQTEMIVASQQNVVGVTRVHITGALDHSKLDELHKQAKRLRGVSIYPEIPSGYDTSMYDKKHITPRKDVDEPDCDERTKNFVKAGQLFNLITGASYYGMQFRTILATDPEAMKAAEKLVERLHEGGCQGML